MLKKSKIKLQRFGVNKSGVLYGNCSCGNSQEIPNSTPRENRICNNCGKQITALAISFEASVGVSADMGAKVKDKTGKIVRKIKSGSEYNHKLGRFVERYQDSDKNPGGLYKKKVSYVDENGNEVVLKDQEEVEAHHKPDHLKRSV